MALDISVVDCDVSRVPLKLLGMFPEKVCPSTALNDLEKLIIELKDDLFL